MLMISPFFIFVSDIVTQTYHKIFVTVAGYYKLCKR